MHLIARTAMHPLHLAAGARMTMVDGWEVPAAYAGAEAEARAVREGSGLWDLSPCAKWDVRGADAPEVVRRVLGVGPPLVGRAATATVDGRNLAALRLAPDRVLVLGPPGTASEVVWGALPGDGCAHLVDLSSGLAGMRVAGPAARSILATLTALDVAPLAFPDLACAETGLARVHAIILRRDLADLPAFEMYAGRNYGAYLWEAFLEAGRSRGLVPCGLESERFLDSSTPAPAREGNL